MCFIPGNINALQNRRLNFYAQPATIRAMYDFICVNAWNQKGALTQGKDCRGEEDSLILVKSWSVCFGPGKRSSFYSNSVI